MQPLNEEQRDLALHALTRADQIAARYARIFPEHADDLASSAIWGVLKAATTFMDGGAKWENWSANEARNECRRFLRHPDFKRQVVWDELAPEYEPSTPAQEVVERHGYPARGLAGQAPRLVPQGIPRRRHDRGRRDESRFQPETRAQAAPPGVGHIEKSDECVNPLPRGGRIGRTLMLGRLPVPLIQERTHGTQTRREAARARA